MTQQDQQVWLCSCGRVLRDITSSLTALRPCHPRSRGHFPLHAVPLQPSALALWERPGRAGPARTPAPPRDRIRAPHRRSRRWARKEGVGTAKPSRVPRNRRRSSKKKQRRRSAETGSKQRRLWRLQQRRGWRRKQWEAGRTRCFSQPQLLLPPPSRLRMLLLLLLLQWRRQRRLRLRLSLLWKAATATLSLFVL